MIPGNPNISPQNSKRGQKMSTSANLPTVARRKKPKIKVNQSREFKRRSQVDLYKQLKDSECTYFLCPDSKCQLFTKLDCHVPCEFECPKSADKAIVCWNCKTVINLGYKHCSFFRVDCKCGAANFQRMSGKYRRCNL